jgi:cellulose synthase/poly-beta-1,6-N-acetylglucosamine synthase-like glycosyltransferase
VRHIFIRVSNVSQLFFQRCQHSALLATVTGTWLLLISHFLPTYFDIARNIHSPLIGVAGAVTISWLNLTALFAVYHVVSFLASLWARAIGCKAQLANISEETPAVAVLYPCMNDFDEQAFRSCLDLQYNNFSVFILDDSTDENEIRRVDEIKNLHPGQFQVIRRASRVGFKAGNLNYGISAIGPTVEYYCIVDSDERLPSDFLRRSVSIAEADKSLGFVQAAHRTYSRTDVADMLGGGLLTHWNYFLPIRNYLGFQSFIGHGALLKSSAVQAVQGFRHVVAEDLDIAISMRMKGYRGFFDFDTNCLEAMPDSYHSFWIRSGKILTGTLEFLFERYPAFARCYDVPIAEKLDVLLAAGVVLLPVLFVAFLGVLFICIPSLYIALGGTASGYLTALRYALAPLEGVPFSFFVLFTILAPMVYAIPDIIAKPIRSLMVIPRLGVAHLAICIPLAVRAFNWIWAKNCVFVATGDRSREHIKGHNSWMIRLPNCCCALLGIAIGSASLLAIGIAGLLLPSLYRQVRPRTAVSILSCLVYLLALSTSFVDPVAAAIGAGVCSSVACLHH